MSIDRYRVNAWLAKKAIDYHLQSYQRQEKPSINVDAVVFWIVVGVCLFLVAFLLGYSDGQTDKESTTRAEPASLQTKCTSYDIRDGQKYCLTWKRI